VRKHGVVCWLDLDGHYSGFVEQLIEQRAAVELPFEVHSFRGSHLELMLAVENCAAGTEKTQLLIHLPGFNEDAVRTAPLYELYAAGTRCRKALSTLITEAAAGQVRPDQIEAFLATDDLTLASADQWLTEAISTEGDAFGQQLKLLKLPALVEELLSGGDIAKRADSAEGRAAILARLAKAVGITDQWATESLQASRMSPVGEALAFAAASWALCVEYVHDLKRPPAGDALLGIRDLPAGVVTACSELADYLRSHKPNFYRRTADETELRLGEEYEIAQAADLGKIDTFRFEEDRVLDAALAAIENGEWTQATEWADAHTGDRSFWLSNRPERRSTWQLIGDAARLGTCLQQAGPSLGKAENLDAAVDRYVAAGAAVDRAHRHLEQRREALLYSQVARFESLRPALDQMRARWRTWADTWATEFSGLCRREGFLPASDRQQRTLFDDVVKPLVCDHEITVLFLVDALRYELGEELHATFAGTSATNIQLGSRLAELPTITSVGMNVLAPVSDKGPLKLELEANGRVAGFSTGTFRVHDPDTRKRSMHDRVGGDTCPWLSLSDVLSRNAASLKKSIARARLVIVHSMEIDEAGEKGAGPAVFDTALQKLKTAWQLLREAGARRFVVTADHGFLLLDDSVKQTQHHGRKIDPHRRHVLSPVSADHAGEVRVPLKDLGYETDDLHVMFPETTAVFDTGRTSSRFVHGGNSFQERVIPVLTLVHRSAAGGNVSQYVIKASRNEGVGGMHCIAGMVSIGKQQTLDFGGVREIELTVRVPDHPDVQIELCETRQGAKLSAGAVLAQVGEPFELFFRLTGPDDARVTAELSHAGTDADVVSCVVSDRFTVAPSGKKPASTPSEQTEAKPKSREWLLELPEGGVRELFDHLATHGIVTETEAGRMLGGARGVRRFSSKLEELAAVVPFQVRVDNVSGVKRYVREGFS
tara:strand:- start:12374 stop:15193 length:2820 start_codon:yes stop_codon:yes gene_type:complete